VIFHQTASHDGCILIDSNKCTKSLFAFIHGPILPCLLSIATNHALFASIADQSRSFTFNCRLIATIHTLFAFQSQLIAHVCAVIQANCAMEVRGKAQKELVERMTIQR
jgi:hypothetical protein